MDKIMKDTRIDASPSAGQSFDARGIYAWYTVGILIFANALAYMDRQILTMLVGPIRSTLQISDFQISLLHGVSFALFYTMLGIPLGWLADRAKRTRMIAIGVLVWSVTTSMCGLARSFGQLFMTRVAVGAGEAALAPTAYSLLSDIFPARELPRALSFYMTGIYLGAGFAAIASGALIAIVPPLDLPLLGHFEPWQAIFLILGAPGILVAILVVTLREPTRKGLSRAPEKTSLNDTLAFLHSKRGSLGLFAAGSALASMIWNATSTWIPTLFIRIHGWSAPEVGLWFGLALLICGAGGVVTGGFLSSKMRDAGRLDSNVLMGLFSVLAAMPFGIAGALVADDVLAISLFYFFTFFACLPFGCAASALQEITPNQMRGQVSALYILLANAAGIAIGPSVVAFFTDFVFGQDTALPSSIALTIAVVTPMSAILLWFGAASYRRELTAQQSANQ